MPVFICTFPSELTVWRTTQINFPAGWTRGLSPDQQIGKLTSKLTASITSA
jgi:hypothetical protein